MSEAKIHLSTLAGPEPTGPTPTRETPFCIVVLGDFGGHEMARSAGIGTGSRGPDWRPRRATPDTVMKLAGLRPRLPIGSDSHLEIESLDSFHPDRLFELLPDLDALREARAALLEGRDPDIDLEAEILASPPLPAREPATDDDLPRPDLSDSPAAPAGGFLDAIVGAAEPQSSTPPESGDDLRDFVRAVSRKHSIRETPDRSADIARVDGALSERLRRLLHAPGVQALEALWRGLAFLLSRVDTTGKVRVYLVDVPRLELQRDVAAAEDLSRTRLAELLLGLGPDAIPHPWALAIGAYTLGGDRSDIELLAGIAAICGVAGVAWISEGSFDLTGASSMAELEEPDTWGEPPSAWAALRAMPGMDHIALATPAFVLREPFGAMGRRAKRFAFEERSDDDGSGVLWGHPAFACAAVLGRGFANRGPGGPAGDDLDLSPIPSIKTGPRDSPRLTRATLSPVATARLADSGLTPLAAFPREARIRVPGIRSAAVVGGSRLRAWWSDAG